MKKTTLKILYIVLIAGLYSCSRESDFDNSDNSAQLKTIQQQIDVLYKTGVPSFYAEADGKQGPMLAFGGYLSGYFSNELSDGNTLADACQSLSFKDPKIQGLSEKIALNCLSAIQLSEEIIEQLNAQETSNISREKLLGEARFFRAINCFCLLKIFGSVPQTKDSVSSQVSKKSLYEGYEQIVSDLRFAISVLAEKTFVENEGRITLFASQALLADVYLTMSGYPLLENRYEEAASIARNLINSGKHQLAVHGASDETSAYNTLRLSATNPEYIYVYNNPSEISLSTFSLPYKAASWSGIKLPMANNAYRPHADFMKFYDTSDLRAKDKQFFHRFYGYENDGKTIFEIFNPAPYFWYQEELVLNGSAINQHVGIYRYAEILLIAAEAIVRVEGVTPEAVKYFTDVQQRAFPEKPRAQIEAALLALDEKEFVEEVWKERLRELPFEMKIWSDIQRTRMYPSLSPTESGHNLIFIPIQTAKTPNGTGFATEQLLLPTDF